MLVSRATVSFSVSFNSPLPFLNLSNYSLKAGRADAKPWGLLSQFLQFLIFQLAPEVAVPKAARAHTTLF